MDPQFAVQSFDLFSEEVLMLTYNQPEETLVPSTKTNVVLAAYV